MKSISILRYAILIIFPVGLWVVAQQYYNYPEFIQEFSYLTSVSFVSSFTVLYRLKDSITKQIHLWTIFVVFLLGHYIQFFLMVYWKLTSYNKFNTLVSPSVRQFLASPDILIEAYKVATICSFALAFAILWVTRKKLKVKASFFRLPLLRISQRLGRVNITKYIVFVIIIAITLLAVHINFKLGRQIGQEVASVRLSFKLAGFIHYGNVLVIPSSFLLLIYLADMVNDKSAAWLGTFAYLIQSVVIAIVTTSRTPIVLSLASLFIIWSFSNRLTFLRLSLLAMIIPLLPFTFSVLMGLRFAREIGEVGSIAQIPQVLETLSHGSQIVDNDGSSYTLLIRFNGMNTLLDFISYCKSYNLHFSIDRIPDFFNMDFIYGSEILKIKGYGTGLFSLGISSGFTAALYFIFVNDWAIGLGLFLFVILWDKLFHFFLDSSLIIKPLVLVQLAMFGCLFISEGTLITLLVQIGVVFVVAIAGEIISRKLILSST
jgi:hypothetical protein